MGRPIDYSGNLPTITGVDIKEEVKCIFSHKTPEWGYENEYRFVKFFDKFHKEVFIKVKIEAVYLGLKVKSADKKFLYKLIKKIDDSISVYEMKEDSLHGEISDLRALGYNKKN